MVNPCIECLVSICCSKICIDKLNYTDHIIKNLTRFYDRWLDEEKQISNLPTHLMEEMKRLVNICEQNMKETNNIFLGRGQ